MIDEEEDNRSGEWTEESLWKPISFVAQNDDVFHWNMKTAGWKRRRLMGFYHWIAGGPNKENEDPERLWAGLLINESG
ncbi:hypothetical protein ACH5RR_011226, partial [Cinchona calisaya]